MAKKFLAVAAVLGAAWVFFGVWNSDARRIGRQLSILQKLAAKTALENDLEGANRARRITDLFALEFELRAEPENYATSSRQDLVRAVMLYRRRSRNLLVQVSREELFVERDGRSATHYALVEFVNDLGDFAGTESYPLRIEWVMEDGDWRIRRLELLNEPAR